MPLLVGGPWLGRLENDEAVRSSILLPKQWQELTVCSFPQTASVVKFLSSLAILMLVSNTKHDVSQQWRRAHRARVSSP